MQVNLQNLHIQGKHGNDTTQMHHVGPFSVLMIGNMLKFSNYVMHFFLH